MGKYKNKKKNNKNFNSMFKDTNMSDTHCKTIHDEWEKSVGKNLLKNLGCNGFK